MKLPPARPGRNITHLYHNGIFYVVRGGGGFMLGIELVCIGQVACVGIDCPVNYDSCLHHCGVFPPQLRLSMLSCLQPACFTLRNLSRRTALGNCYSWEVAKLSLRHSFRCSKALALSGAWAWRKRVSRSVRYVDVKTHHLDQPKLSRICKRAGVALMASPKIPFCECSQCLGWLGSSPPLATLPRWCWLKS